MFVRTDDVYDILKSHPELTSIEICQLLAEDYDSLSHMERVNTLSKVRKAMVKLRKQGYVEGTVKATSGRYATVTLNGRTQSMRAWALEYGMAETTVRSRIKRGWSLEDALTVQPIKRVIE